MFRNFLFTMSLSGTVVFLAYMILSPLAHRYFPARWRYYSLCMCILFYLFPLPLMKNRFLLLLRSQPVIKETFNLQAKIGVDNSYLIVYYGDKFQIAPRILYIWGLIGFSGILSLLLILKTFRNYRRAKRSYTSIAAEQAPERWMELLHKTSAQLKIRKKIRLLCSSGCTGPVTWGAFSPVILFPASYVDMDEKTFCLMLKHELTHIKYHHLHIKYIGLLVRTVHWFNPMIYLWFQELCNLSEMMCDEIVTKDMEPEQSRQYCRMILFCAADTDISCQSLPFSAHLSEDAAVLKRRISEMKNKKKKKLISALLLALVFGTSGTITAFAYAPPDVMEDRDDQFGDYYIITEEEDHIDDTAELPYDYYYTDSNGNVYPLSEDTVILNSCSHHDWTAITVTRHTADGKGGCNITESQAWKCEHCGNIKIGDKIRTIHYDKCPH